MKSLVFLLLISLAVAPGQESESQSSPRDTIASSYKTFLDLDKKDECLRSVVKVLKDGCEGLSNDKKEQLAWHIYNCRNQENEEFDIVKLCGEDEHCPGLDKRDKHMERLYNKVIDMCHIIMTEVISQSVGVSAYGLTKNAHSIVKNTYDKIVLPVDPTVMMGMEKAATILGIETSDVRTFTSMLSDGLTTSRTALYLVVGIFDGVAFHNNWFGGRKPIIISWIVSFLIQLFKMEELSKVPVLSFFLGADAPRLLLKYQHVLFFIANVAVGLLCKSQRHKGRPKKSIDPEAITRAAEAASGRKRRNKIKH